MYSSPVDMVIEHDDLLQHLFSRPDMPDAIPYVTSYYNDNWGFCLTENQRSKLTDEKYKVVIKSRLFKGSMTYGEILIPGESSEEILIHSYSCHPSMGNNETSGMSVLTYLARSILDMPVRRYSYRIVIVPETIGAVAYVSKNLEALKQNVKAGYILTCVGDDRTYSFMPSRKDGTLSERAARHALERVLKVDYKAYSFLERGSDERQYCAPGVDLPIVSIMRSKYATYPEYHTSKDDMDLISSDGLYGGYLATKTAIDILEANETFEAVVLCEPWLGKRGLRPPLTNGRDLVPWSKLISNILAYSDGEHDLLSIAELLECSIFDVKKVADMLLEHDLLRVSENEQD